MISCMMAVRYDIPASIWVLRTLRIRVRVSHIPQNLLEIIENWIIGNYWINED